MSIFLQLLAWLALVAALGLSPAFPEVTNVVTLSVMGVSLVMVLVAPARRAVLAHGLTWLPTTTAGVLLILALLPTTRSFENFAVLLILAPIWLSAPLSALLQTLGTRLTPTVIASIALAGASIAAGITAFDYYARGLTRAGASTMNPIHMGDLALMLGFVALTGSFASRTPWRFVFILGPVLALCAVWWTGSRGPLVAGAAMILVSVVYAASLLESRLRTVFLGVVAIVTAIVAIHSVMAGWLWQIRGLDQIVALISTSSTSDNSINLRLTMYLGAFQAFMASPLYGHGFVDFIQAVARMAPDAGIERFEHLHNDIANFAVIGGSLGLLSYLVILAAPLVHVVRFRNDDAPAMRYLALVAVCGYFVMGLTNAMFGILVLTVLYGALLAIVTPRASAAEPTRETQAAAGLPDAGPRAVI